MEISYINENDNPLEISTIYEESWKFAYKDIIPQDYLNRISHGRWVDSIKKEGMSSNVILT